MPNILQVIDTCGPGGAETVYVELSTGFPAEVYPTVAVLTGPGWVADTLRKRGVEPVFVPMGNRLDWRFVLQLARLVRQRRIDVIHAHLFSTGVYAALVALLTRRRLIVTMHGHTEIDQGRRLAWLRFGLLRLAAERIVTVSDSLAGLLTRRGFPSRQVMTVHNGVDPSRFRRDASRALRERLGVPAGHVLLGAVGNFRGSKDYANLVRALAHARDLGAPVTCAVIGQEDDRYYPEAERLRADLGLEDRLHFLGFQDDVPGFLSGLDGLVLSSSAEGFSIVVVEAMVAGLPVVATRCGGPEDIITHDEDGWLVPPRDSAALGKAMSDLAARPDLRKRLAGAAAASAARRFTLQAMLARYRQLYDHAGDPVADAGAAQSPRR
ncbi:MAG: glycosyltransferase [Ectothiorhodospiraceae bacterium]|nr:glycosyltransferase [Ectothiorhodospiraceae bacterium]